MKHKRFNVKQIVAWEAVHHIRCALSEVLGTAEDFVITDEANGPRTSTWKPLNTNYAIAQHGMQPRQRTAATQQRSNAADGLTFGSFESIVIVPVNTKWPAHFPGGCPPVDAVSAQGLVYRIVANTRPAPEEFLSAYERTQKS